jgi:hypothetical protein
MFGDLGYETRFEHRIIEISPDAKIVGFTIGHASVTSKVVRIGPAGSTGLTENRTYIWFEQPKNRFAREPGFKPENW